MRIVVLDGHVVNPGDNPWDALAALGELTVYDRTAPEDVLERAKDAEIVLTTKTRLPAETIARLPVLQYIGVLATGYDVVDAAAAAQRGVVVTNAPGYATNAVAEHVFALLFALFRRAEAHNAGVKQGKWAQNPDWCYWEHTQVDMAGKVMGIIGFGNTGRRVAELARAFGMSVLAYSPRPKAPLAACDSPAEFAFVELDELLARADVISLHCPLTALTRSIMSASRIAAMRPGGYLINTARGGLVDEQAVADALRDGHLAGAGFDVVSKEPIEPDNPLLTAPNCLITPHIAWASLEARTRLTAMVVENVAAFLHGSPIHVVNRVGA